VRPASVIVHHLLIDGIAKRKYPPCPQASVWKPTCRHGKDYQAIVPACQPRPAGACDDPRMGVRGPDEAAAKLLARTVEKAAADALPPDAVQVCGVQFQRTSWCCKNTVRSNCRQDFHFTEQFATFEGINAILQSEVARCLPYFATAPLPATLCVGQPGESMTTTKIGHADRAVPPRRTL